MAWPVLLYLPNVVGYLRILASFYAFYVAFDHPGTFTWLYLASFVGDYLDGRFAVWFDQKSTFGAVLDMVTDRLCTTCLLVVLSHLFLKDYLLFLFLISLDIGSHWFQMYSSFLARKTSHKDLSEEDMFLMRLYYGNRAFMAYCCIGAELLYLAAYLMRDKSLGTDKSFYDHLMARLESTNWTTDVRLSASLALLAAPGWALKQVINVVQLKQAIDVCIQFDLDKRQGPSKTD